MRYDAVALEETNQQRGHATGGGETIFQYTGGRAQRGDYRNTVNISGCLRSL